MPAALRLLSIALKQRLMHRTFESTHSRVGVYELESVRHCAKLLRSSPIPGPPMSRVLILDDEPSYLRLLKRLLVGDGHEVWTASTSDEAYSLAIAHRPEIAVVDWMLGEDADGLSAVERLRGLDSEIRIVMMSGFVSARAKLRAQQLAVEGVLEKPFPIDDLLDMVGSQASGGCLEE